MTALRIESIAGDYAVCRLPAGSEAPPDPGDGALFSVTRTAGEISVVCARDAIPGGARSEGAVRRPARRGHARLRADGDPRPRSPPPLAEADVSAFALSTFDTDYLLVPRGSLGEARAARRRRAPGRRIAGVIEEGRSRTGLHPELLSAGRYPALLPQPGGFEGFLLGLVERERGCRAAPDRDQERASSLNLDAVSSSKVRDVLGDQ